MRLNVDIKDSIYTKFREMAESEGRGVTDVTRQIVVEWIEKRINERKQFAEGVSNAKD